MTRTPLRVHTGPNRTPRKSSEAQFERKIAKLLTEAGCYSYHTSEKHYDGIPDRYVCGGRWIEFKQATVVRSITPMRLFSKGQIRQMDMFTEHGDDCYVCILFQFRDCEPWCVFLSWDFFKLQDGKWDREFIRTWGYQQKDWLFMVRKVFYD